MGINVAGNQSTYACISSPLCIDYMRQSLKGDNYKNLKKDSFERRCPVITPEIKELERLFPNNELKEIYDNLVKDYGLEYPPPLSVGRFTNGEKCMYDYTTNTVSLDLSKLNNNAYKMYLEYTDKDGNKITGYSINEYTGNISLFENPQLDEIAQKTFKDMGVKWRIEPSTDDDKRHTVISLLAHELRHAYQTQMITQTEGLDIKNLIKERKKGNNKNLIHLALYEMNFEKMYANSFWANKNIKPKYSQNSDGGKYARKMYDALMNYPWEIKGSKEYYTNPTELDANFGSKEYLSKKYEYYNSLMPYDKYAYFYEEYVKRYNENKNNQKVELAK